MHKTNNEYETINLFLEEDIFEFNEKGLSNNGLDIYGNGLSNIEFKFEFDPNDFVLDEEIEVK